MGMNTSRDLNPAFWENSLVKKLHLDHGYATGVFGKVLNIVSAFGLLFFEGLVKVTLITLSSFIRHDETLSLFRMTR